MLFNAQTKVGDNLVSSSAHTYPTHNTFETLVEGPQIVPTRVVDEDGCDPDSIVGHASFDEMIRFHENAVALLEVVSGCKREDLYR
jgi:hypothetical protein